MKKISRREAVVGFLSGILGCLLPKSDVAATGSKPASSAAAPTEPRTSLEYQTYLGGTSESTPFPSGADAIYAYNSVPSKILSQTTSYFDASGRLYKTVHQD